MTKQVTYQYRFPFHMKSNIFVWFLSSASSLSEKTPRYSSTKLFGLMCSLVNTPFPEEKGKQTLTWAPVLK